MGSGSQQPTQWSPGSGQEPSSLFTVPRGHLVSVWHPGHSGLCCLSWDHRGQAGDQREHHSCGQWAPSQWSFDGEERWQTKDYAEGKALSPELSPGKEKQTSSISRVTGPSRGGR